MIRQLPWEGNEPCYCPLCGGMPKLNLDQISKKVFAECCRGVLRTVPLPTEPQARAEWNRIANVYILGPHT